MARVRDDYLKAIEKALAEFGVTEWAVAHEGKPHPKLKFRLDGEELAYTLPGSPSDRRGALNCRTDLRRLCRQRRDSRRGKLRT